MEYWKEIEGFEGLYDVSSLGRIRSHERICKAANGTFQKKRARILTQEITIHGYCRVRLYDGEGMPKHYYCKTELQLWYKKRKIKRPID